MHLSSQTQARFPSLHERSQRWRQAAIGLDESDPRIAKLALGIEGFIRRALHNDRSKGTQLLIHGPTGTGKTHAARAFIRVFNSWAVDACLAGHWPSERVPSAELVRWPERCKGDDRDHDSLRDDLRSVSALVLDDIGAEVDRFRTGATTALLRDVLAAFERRWLIVTTNVPRSRWATFWDPRVASRLSACAFVDVTGAKDWRVKQ